jgi:hypothetical protein
MNTLRTASQGIPLGRAALWLGLAIWTISLLRTPLAALADSFFLGARCVDARVAAYSFFIIRAALPAKLQL